MADNTKVLSVVRETLTRELIHPVQIFSVVRENLVGDGYGYNAVAYTYSVVRESLVKEAPIQVSNVLRETLVSRPAEDATQAYLAGAFNQAVLMVRPPMADPATVRSMIEIASYRELVLGSRIPVAPFSALSTSTLVQHAVLKRNVLSAPEVFSPLRSHSLRMQIVQSRGRAYEPISMVYTAQLRSQVVAHRATTPAGDVRTPINVGAHAQQIVQSRVHAQVVIQTYAYVAKLYAQVVQQDTRAAPISMMEARTLRMLVLREHVMPAPGIDDRVLRLQQQVTQARAITPPHGEDQVAAAVQQAVQARTPVVPLSSTIVKSMRGLVVMRKDTFPPAYALGRHTASLIQQVIQDRSVIVRHSVTAVGSMRMQFVLAKDTPAPIEVIDPSVGRHAFSLRMLAVQRRVTEPPEQISTLSRFVYGIAARVIIGDVFPPPPYPEETHEIAVSQVVEHIAHRDTDDWEPVSALSVRTVKTALVLGDNGEWIDPTVPMSDAVLSGIAQQVAVGGEQYPNPYAPHSDAEVVMLGSAVVVGDATLPDPTIPLSEIEARAVVEFAAVGDAEWSDPTIPLSEIVATHLASFLAVHDPSLTGTVGGSDLSALSVVEFYVIRDPTLEGIPLRSGPRPVVSVTIS